MPQNAIVEQAQDAQDAKFSQDLIVDLASMSFSPEQVLMTPETQAEIAALMEPNTHPRYPAVKFKKMPHFEGLPNPANQSKLASGFDVSAANFEPINLNKIGAMAVVPTGLKIQVPVGYEAQVRPRSGLAAKHGITVTNTPGTIDADYRGEIKILLVNLHGRRFMVERGNRIAQIVICPVGQSPLEFVDELDATDRGEGGFGSTGVN